MVQAVEVFVDSSVLVEYIKDRKVTLLNYLLERQRDLAINSTVISEFLFYFIGFKGDKSPMTLKRNNSIRAIINQHDPVAILEDFTVLPESSDTALVVSLMKKYNLLPNDALILATCLRHEIPYFASYDVNDFASACADEGIVLLSDEQEAKRHIPSV